MSTHALPDQVVGHHVGHYEASGWRTVSGPKEANRKARFSMAMESEMDVKHVHAVHEFRQSAAGDARASILSSWASLQKLLEDF